MKKIILLLILLLIFPYSYAKAQNGKLEKIEQSVYKKPAENKKEIPGERKKNCSRDNVSDDPMAELYFLILTSPFSIPYALLEDCYDLNNYYYLYPFASEDIYTDETSKSYSGKFEYGHIAANDDISVSYFSGLFQHKRIGLNIEQSHYKEVLNNGQKDHLKTSSATLFFDFARNNTINLRSGIGIKELERSKNKRGVNFIYDIDWFIRKPFHLSNRFEYSRIGSANILRYTPSIGIIYNRFEVSGGYRYERFDEEKIKGFELKTTLWF